MAFRWRADYGPTLNASFIIFQWVRTCIPKETDSFVRFDGRSGPTDRTPSGSAHARFLREVQSDLLSPAN